MSGNETIFSVKLGHRTEPFMFAGVRGQKDWMHGPEKTQFTDLPKGGIFRWSTFALVVAVGAASVTIPVFVATCPTDINVDDNGAISAASPFGQHFPEKDRR